MANLTPFIHHFQKNGTARVILLLTHKSQRKKISTEVFVTRADVTKGGKIKSEGIRNEIDKIISGYRNTIIKLGFAINSMSIDDLKYAITNLSEQNIDFYEFGQEFANKMKADGRSSHKNVTATLNSLKRFCGSNSLPVNQITLDFIRRYEAWLKTTPAFRPVKKNKKSGKPDIPKPIGTRGITLYMGIIRHLLNQARLKYNDEENGIINIKVNPFLRYKMPLEQPTERTVLSVEQMRTLINAEIPSSQKRMKLARDIFLLSFYLIGMNAEDLFASKTAVKNGTITYYRSKTTGRRKDRAKIIVRVEQEANELVKNYADKEGERLFQFYKRYATTSNFTVALNKGLEQLAGYLTLPKITFYSARHTWATLAANECRINIYTIHKALNHVDTKMQITKTYIREDFRDIWDANRQVIDLLKH
ncbi:MAG: site-specific integrase [Lentimicrobium sp.]|nr:site-specific integrase [Lentimicrobium sp.]MEA5111724.1 site-specific integrase [Lentimicrobium sp.]